MCQHQQQQRGYADWVEDRNWMKCWQFDTLKLNLGTNLNQSHAHSLSNMFLPRDGIRIEYLDRSTFDVAVVGRRHHHCSIQDPKGRRWIEWVCDRHCLVEFWETARYDGAIFGAVVLPFGWRGANEEVAWMVGLIAFVSSIPLLALWWWVVAGYRIFEVDWEANWFWQSRASVNHN